MTGSQTLAPSVERTSLSSVQTLRAGRQRWVLVGLPYFIRGDFILWVWLGCKNPLRDEFEVGEWGQQYQPAISNQMKCFPSLWCWPYKPRKPLRTSQHHTAFSAKGMLLPSEMSWWRQWHSHGSNMTFSDCFCLLLKPKSEMVVGLAPWVARHQSKGFTQATE